MTSAALSPLGLALTIVLAALALGVLGLLVEVWWKARR